MVSVHGACGQCARVPTTYSAVIRPPPNPYSEEIQLANCVSVHILGHNPNILFLIYVVLHG